MRIISKFAAAVATASLGIAPVVAQATVRPAPAKLALSGTRLGSQTAQVARAGAIKGERENLALGLLPLLAIGIGAITVIVVINEVVSDSSPD